MSDDSTRRERLYLGFSLLVIIYVYAVMIYHLCYKCKWRTFFKYLTNWTFTVFTVVTTITLMLHVVNMDDLDTYGQSVIFAVLSFTGYTIRVVYLFVCVAYYVGYYVSHRKVEDDKGDDDESDGRLSFIDISKHAIFVMISLMFQFIVHQPHFEVMIDKGAGRLFSLSAIYSLAPIGFLYLYGAFYICYYYRWRSMIYSMHEGSLMPILITGLVAAPFCYIVTLLLAVIDVYVKNTAGYLEWMNSTE